MRPWLQKQLVIRNVQQSGKTASQSKPCRCYGIEYERRRADEVGESMLYCCQSWLLPCWREIEACSAAVTSSPAKSRAQRSGVFGGKVAELKEPLARHACQLPSLSYRQ